LKPRRVPVASDSKTRFDVWADRAKNNRGIAAILLIAAVIGALLGIVNGIVPLWHMANSTRGFELKSARLLSGPSAEGSLLAINLQNNSDVAVPVNTIILHAWDKGHNDAACKPSTPQEVTLSLEKLPTGEHLAALTTLEGVMINVTTSYSKNYCAGGNLRADIPIEQIVSPKSGVFLNFRIHDFRGVLASWDGIEIGTDASARFIPIVLR
jgi:hypothetical protein